MNFSIRNIFSLFVMLFSVGVMSFVSEVSAQEGEPWQVRCSEPKNGGKKLCEITQRISVAKTGQRVAELTIGAPDKNGLSKAVIALPLGILVQEKIIFKIDDNKPVGFGVKFCVPAGCISNLSLKKEIIDKLKRGNKVVIMSKSADGKPVNIELSLKGFTKKYKSL